MNATRFAVWTCPVVSLLVICAIVSCKPRTPSAPAAATNTKVSIGAVLPLTGDAGAYGQSAKRGIDLALDAINASRPAGAPQLAVIYEDSQASPAKAVSAFRKLITADKVHAVLGDLLSSNTLAMAPVANERKVVLLSPASSAPDITKAGDYIFRNCPSDTLQGTLMAEYARDPLKLDTVAIVYVNNDYGVGIRDIFEKSFTGKGGKVVTKEAYAQDATNFRSQLTNVIGAKPQAVYLIGYKELGTLLKQATELGVKGPFLSTVTFEDPEIVKIAGAGANGVVYTSHSYNPDQQDSHIQAFVEGYRDRYGSDPDIFGALSYDAMKILASTISKSQTTSEDIKQALYGIKDYPGVAGRTTFDNNGDVLLPATLKTVKQGKFVYLDNQ